MERPHLDLVSPVQCVLQLPVSATLAAGGSEEYTRRLLLMMAASGDCCWLLPVTNAHAPAVLAKVDCFPKRCVLAAASATVGCSRQGRVGPVVVAGCSPGSVATETGSRPADADIRSLPAEDGGGLVPVRDDATAAPVLAMVCADRHRLAAGMPDPAALPVPVPAAARHGLALAVWQLDAAPPAAAAELAAAGVQSGQQMGGPVGPEPATAAALAVAACHPVRRRTTVVGREDLVFDDPHLPESVESFASA